MAINFNQLPPLHGDDANHDDHRCSLAYLAGYFRLDHLDNALDLINHPDLVAAYHRQRTAYLNLYNKLPTYADHQTWLLEQARAAILNRQKQLRADLRHPPDAPPSQPALF